MTPKTLLVTRPNYDYTTRYISAWAKVVIDFAKGRISHVLDLDADRASRKELESMIKKHNPSLVFLNGHGDHDLVSGQHGEVLVEAGVNEKILKGAVVYALSCRSGRGLGPATARSGAEAYLGYDNDFIFMYSESNRTRPREDKTAAQFLDPSNQVMISLLKGHTPQDSLTSAKRAFLRNIQRLLTSESSVGDTSAVRYLLWDMKSLRCCTAERQS